MRSVGKKALSVFIAGIIVFSIFSSGIELFTASAANVTGDEIVEYARQFLGYRYVKNTHGPDTFDCSGFVYYVFKHFGITLSTDSNVYYKTPEKFGTVIDISEVQAGDVMAWSGHVGIYTCNGNMINASNPTDGVKENEWKHYGASPKVIRINGVGDTEIVDNKTYSAVLFPAGKRGVTYAKTDEDMISVSVKGKEMEVILQSSSFKDGKIYLQNAGNFNNGKPVLARFGIIDFDAVEYEQPPENGHAFWLYMYVSPEEANKESINFDNVVISFSYSSQTEWVHIAGAPEGSLDLWPKDDSSHFYTNLYLKESTREDYCTTKKPVISCKGNCIAFKFSLPEKVDNSEIVFNNSKVSLTLPWWEMGIESNDESLSFIQIIFNNIKSFFVSVIDFFKSIFKF